MKPLVTCDNRYAISHSPCVNTRPSSSNHNSCNTHRIKIANRVHDSYAAKVNRNINVRNSNTNRIHKTYSYGGPNIDMVGQINDSQMNINKIYSRYDGTHKFTAGRKNTTSNGNPIHNNFNFNRMCNSHGGTNITSVGQIKDSNMNIKKSFNCYDGTHKFLANTNSNVNPMLNNFYANFNPLYNNLNANAYNNKNRASNSVKTHMNASKTCSSYDANNNPAPVKQNNSIVSINIIFSYYDGAHKIPARLKNTKRHNLNANFNPVYKDSNTNVNNNSNRIKSKTHMNANKTYNSYDDSNNPTSAGQINRLVLSNDKRLKVNRSSDRDFYSFPRFVTHVDDAFISSLTELYRERIPPGAEVLDLMSSWISHLPPEIQYKRVVGHGLNAQELARNPRLDYFFVKDLNEDQTLEAEDCSFDAVLCTVSVQYLQQPEKVFAEIYRILRPGGLCIVSFSNRMFYEKAISAWREGTDYSKIQLVVQYFQCVTGFTQPETVKKIPKSEANSPFGWLLRLLGRMTSDPFYAVIAYRNFKTV